jgi:hypothetical protein
LHGVTAARLSLQGRGGATYRLPQAAATRMRQGTAGNCCAHW